ncbi:MAG TPA: OmpA family protein [Terracidiphilus sp.]|jgi:outer membrane protein OmpA-like peptidoglycan-associated protein
MTNSNRKYSVLIMFLAAAGWLSAQESNPTENKHADSQQTPIQLNNGEPLYKIQVVARDIPAINYFHRKEATNIGFIGTALLPQARGSAKVEARGGRTVIDLKLAGLSPANGFGPEYMTYVLWAVTPEGRPINLGEVLPTGGKDRAEMTVTANLQTFGLIVTAEPYYAVTMPSDLVVAQNVVEDRTQGVIEQVNAHYTLLPRGAYAETAGRHTVLHPVTRDEKSPMELYEAVNAINIADAAGATKYASDTMETARTALKNAQDMDGHKGDRKQIITFSREAVQSAEDARIITIRKIKEEDEANERKARADAEASAKESQAAAEEQAARREKADADRRAAEEAKREADARSEQARLAQQQAEAAAQQANQQAQLASQQAEQMREKLKQQLNQVLQTKETARGLIVNMSDVLFDFNKYTLKPEAREKLAKVSGILLAYPNLKLQVEGYTDNIGSDEYNQKLSEQRADGVRDYLVAQSVPDGNISAQGLGKTHPIADNSTNSGRAQNRRVELVVSGDAIGIQEQAPGSGADNQPPPVPAQPAPQPNPSGVANPPQQ